ncbi:hypothetical protein CEXT_278441 [Caerostris extrusa]|uniref:Uncharacterized protein n=1 Tax=Caerostris extrusa TaxID=172846 RepID=A0AAV4PHX7_CAEEX|nr:hypothetical protein CEXT_278441 [Caerostris extrusa]
MRFLGRRLSRNEQQTTKGAGRLTGKTAFVIHSERRLMYRKSGCFFRHASLEMWFYSPLKDHTQSVRMKRGFENVIEKERNEKFHSFSDDGRFELKFRRRVGGFLGVDVVFVRDLNDSCLQFD